MSFTFSKIEYLDMVCIYGFCDGNARTATEEYRHRYPDRRQTESRVFCRVYQHLRDKESFPGISAIAEWVGAAQEGIVQTAIQSPSISTQRLFSWLGVPHTTVIGKH